jgi:hypothetical protein
MGERMVWTKYYRGKPNDTSKVHLCLLVLAGIAFIIQILPPVQWQSVTVLWGFVACIIGLEVLNRRGRPRLAGALTAIFLNTVTAYYYYINICCENNLKMALAMVTLMLTSVFLSGWMVGIRFSVAIAIVNWFVVGYTQLTFADIINAENKVTEVIELPVFILLSAGIWFLLSALRSETARRSAEWELIKARQHQLDSDKATLQAQWEVLEAERQTLDAEHRALQAERQLYEVKDMAYDFRVAGDQALMTIHELLQQLTVQQQESKLLNDLILSDIIARMVCINKAARPIDDRGHKAFAIGVKLNDAPLLVKIKAEDLKVDPELLVEGTEIAITGKLRGEFNRNRRQVIPYFDAIYVIFVPPEKEIDEVVSIPSRVRAIGQTDE